MHPAAKPVLASPESSHPRIDWRLARRLHSIPFFTYVPIVVIGVPLLAALFLSIRPIVPHLSFPRALGIGFAASVFFLFSHVLFRISCPDIVQEHESPEEYAKASESFEAQNYAHVKLEFVATHIDEQNKLDELEALKRAGDSQKLDARVNEYYPIAIRRYVMKKYLQSAAEKRMALWGVLVLWFTGLCFALWLMYGRVQEVIEALRTS